MYCSVAGCGIAIRSTHNKSGMCAKHVTKHANDVATAKRRAERPSCSVSGCDKKLKVGNSIGVCRAHRHLGAHTEAVSAPIVAPSLVLFCRFADCSAALRSCNKSGLCRAHRDTTPERTKNRRTPEQKAAFREYQVGYVEANRDVLREKSREYARLNRLEMRARRAKWAKDNPHKEVARVHRRRAAKANAPGSWTESEWLAILEHYGHMCVMCGSREELTRDHIIPLSHDDSSNWPTNLQPMCLSCNSSKQGRARARYLPWDGQAPRIDSVL